MFMCTGSCPMSSGPEGHKRVASLSAALALAEAWGGLTLAFYTDWPTSFWITTLGAAAYATAMLAGRRA